MRACPSSSGVPKNVRASACQRHAYVCGVGLVLERDAIHVLNATGGRPYALIAIWLTATTKACSSQMPRDPDQGVESDRLARHSRLDLGLRFTSTSCQSDRGLVCAGRRGRRRRVAHGGSEPRLALGEAVPLRSRTYPGTIGPPRPRLERPKRASGSVQWRRAGRTERFVRQRPAD